MIGWMLYLSTSCSTRAVRLRPRRRLEDTHMHMQMLMNDDDDDNDDLGGDAPMKEKPSPVIIPRLARTHALSSQRRRRDVLIRPCFPSRGPTPLLTRESSLILSATSSVACRSHPTIEAVCLCHTR